MVGNIHSKHVVLHGQIAFSLLCWVGGKGKKQSGHARLDTHPGSTIVVCTHYMRVQYTYFSDSSSPFTEYEAVTVMKTID